MFPSHDRLATEIISGQRRRCADDPIFEIYYPDWNGTDYVYKKVDLLETYLGIHTFSFNQSIQELKAGGIFQNNPLVAGQDLAFAVLANGVETVELKISGHNQLATIAKLNKILKNVRKATLDYWTSRTQNLMPVYIKAKVAEEINPRYAAIVNLTMGELSSVFAQPF